MATPVQSKPTDPATSAVPPATPAAGDKFKRYRARKKAQGMKLVRIWVPDPNAPGFREESERQAALLRGAPEEQEALDFIEAALADVEGREWDEPKE